MSGWAIDPDLGSATVVHIYVDGVLVTGLWANQWRQDIANAYPRYTAEGHAYNISFAWPPGPHTVCAYGINVAGPGGNALLTNGCINI